MPKRQRWTPVKGEANRVYDPVERALLAVLDAVGRLAFGAARLVGGAPALGAAQSEIREVLVLRLDRIGDVVMSLPALADLRAALPQARLRLAVGHWSAEIAKSAPVDELIVWSAPWVGRPAEGAESLRALTGRARALRDVKLDLAIDLQGDVRASMLMWLTGARRRVGYANTGGRYLLTDVVPLDESVSWVEQNRRSMAVATGARPQPAGFDPLNEDDRAFAARLFENLGLERRRPLVAIHPSGGRSIKQWPIERWGALGARLQREFGATLLITGASGDAPLGAKIAKALHAAPIDLSGKLGVRETLAVLERLDLFLSPDTGPMHMACAAGTPSVSVFGPSDPLRYFSGGSGASGTRHVVVRRDLWCSPCNLIRRPPAECARVPVPECLDGVTIEMVFAEAARLLREGGHAPKGDA